MKKSKDIILKVIIGALLAMFVAGGVYYNAKVSSLEEEARRYQNELAQVDTVTVVDSSTVRKLTFLVEKIRLENTLLTKELLGRSSDIKTYTKIIAALQDSVNNIPTTDYIIIPSFVSGLRKFDFVHGPFSLIGTFKKSPPWTINFSKIHADVSLEIATVESKDGTWATYVSSSNTSVFVKDIDTRYKYYKRSIFEKTKLGVGLIANTKSIDGFAIIGFDKYALTAGYGTEGFKVGGIYFIR